MPRFIKLLALILVCILASSCAKQSQQPQPVSNPPNPATATRKAAAPQIKVISAAFKDGEAIPRQHTCQGINISPPLEWTPTPEAKTVAIICNDPDAPSGAWTHWLVYNLPGATMGLIENMPAQEKVAGGGMQGTNDFGKIGYGGPCPPSGTHRYFFKVYALDTELSLKPGATKDQLMKAMEGHILAQGQLMGTYAK
jgi:Raf kinase inhibitor-like YbhB/YbcL family protein